MPHIDSPSPKASHTSPIPAHIRVKNRRKTYLDRNPSYFTSTDLQLSDPILYDRCIRRFQTATEREADGKKKGYSGVLEAGLWLGEARQREREDRDVAIGHEDGDVDVTSEHDPQDTLRSIQHSSAAELEDGVPKTKEEGLEMWKAEMTLRFLAGQDRDFEYGAVDESEEFDGVQEREEEERWFDEEEPEWVHDGGSFDGGTKGTGGETGVQDF